MHRAAVRYGMQKCLQAARCVFDGVFVLAAIAVKCDYSGTPGFHFAKHATVVNSLLSLQALTECGGSVSILRNA